MRSIHVTKHIRAPRALVYSALLDASAVQQWMVPDTMTSHVHSFDPREGGQFRVSLTYDAPTTTGKTTAQTDTYHGRFVRLVQDTQVVQVMEFETDDPALQGETTVSYTLEDAPGGDGTVLSGRHENLPPGLTLADNELGWTQSLGKLARLVEAGSSR
jgi:uncharacterized protein YndB with AHSA1/START domain